MLDQLSDEQLMSSFSNNNDVNNQRAFEVLYQRHKGPLYRFIKKSLNNEQDVHEVFQELWLRIINNKHRFDPQQKFTIWAYTIARRLLIDQFRKAPNLMQHQTAEDTDIAEVPIKQPENEFAAKQMAQQLSTALERLPLAQKQAFVLRHDSGLSIREIAQITEQAPEKAKSQYRYAVQKLKLALERFK